MSTSTLDYAVTATGMAERIHQTIAELSAFLLAELERLDVDVDPQTASTGHRGYTTAAAPGAASWACPSIHRRGAAPPSCSTRRTS